MVRVQKKVGERPLIVIVIAVGTLTLLAWLYLAHLDREMAASMTEMAAMEAMGMPVREPWTPADIGYAFGMWAVMMVGMMAPAAISVLVVVARSGGPHSDSGVAVTTLMFAAGYFAVWTSFSAAAAIAQWQLHDRALLSSTMAVRGPWLSGTILVAAGLYQLTPLKHACLVHCRGPLDFLMTHWRSGVTGAFRMGLHHGIYCLGCCWALMLILFAVGIMNLAWVAVIAAFVLIEKTTRPGALLSKLAGAALMAAGVVILLRSWPP